MRTAAKYLIAYVLPLALPAPFAAAVPGVFPGDYNDDGAVTHADYVVLAEHFGKTVADMEEATVADGDGDGVIGPSDLDLYIDNYGTTLSEPSILPFSITPTATPDGNVAWVLAFSEVDGPLAGHVNIETDGPTILSVTGGPSFMNYAPAPRAMPGIDWNGDVGQGILIDENRAFAALGTTLDVSYSDDTLEFLTLVTEGNQPTILAIEGEYGYGGRDELGEPLPPVDYAINQTATFIPEPGGVLLATLGMLSLLAAARNQKR